MARKKRKTTIAERRQDVFRRQDASREIEMYLFDKGVFQEGVHGPVAVEKAIMIMMVMEMEDSYRNLGFIHVSYEQVLLSMIKDEFEGVERVGITSSFVLDSISKKPAATTDRKNRESIRQSRSMRVIDSRLQISSNGRLPKGIDGSFDLQPNHASPRMQIEVLNLPCGAFKSQYCEHR